MRSFRKNIFVMGLASLLLVAEPAASCVYADDLFTDDAASADEKSQVVSGSDELVGESAGGLFEDQNTNVQSRDGIPTDDGETGKSGKSSRKMIAGFRQTGLIKSITFDEGSKPSLDSLRAQFPGTVDVYFVGENKPETLSTVWQCVGEDYSSSGGSYFLFTPTFDESEYLVRGMSITNDAPYIEVRKKPAVAVEMIESAPPTVNEKKVFEYCTKEMGLSKAAACGILANMYCESGFRTNAIGDGNTSVGVCQWHNGRWTNLRSYTKDWQKLEGQLSFMNYELEHGYSATLNYLKEVTDDAQGAYDAANFWCLHYEMPDSARTRGITRGYLAKNIYWPRYGEDGGKTDEEGCNDSFAGEYVFDGEGSLNIRSGHSEDSEVVGSIPAGGKVEVTRSNGEWAHVIWKGQTGLCRMEYLTVVELTAADREIGAETEPEDNAAAEAGAETEPESENKTEADSEDNAAARAGREPETES